MRAPDPSVTHLYDCAGVGSTLVKFGKTAGYRWRFHPAREAGADAPLGALGNKVLAAAWHAERFAKVWSSDLIHLHYGLRAKSLAWPPHRPHVVHIHGSDISIHYQTSAAAKATIQAGLDSARAVIYSTPDLEDATRSARADAIYLPNPVDVTVLPQWRPAPKPTVVFSSRWERRKGSDVNLEVARQIISATNGAVAVEALDWGDEDSRKRARELGVTLVPKMSRPDYLAWLSRAHVTVGHQGGILAISEFESVAIGVPTVMGLGAGYYPGPHPVLEGTTANELTEQVLAALEDPHTASRELNGRDWVQTHHSPQASVAQLAGIYRSIATA